MIKEGLLLLVLVILCVLGYALRQMFLGNQESLEHSFRWRIGLSILLLVLVIVAYYAGWLAPSAYIQFL